MIKQNVSIAGKIKMVSQSILTKKDDGTFHYKYNEDMSPDTSPDIAVLYSQAKELLSLAISADIESGGYTWQVRNAIDLQNIQDAIDEHNYAELEPDVTQSFRMADNTWQDLTVDKFEKVLSDYRLRKKDIYSSYKAWTSGEMLEAFEV